MSILAVISLIFLAGACLLNFFVLLAGGIASFPLTLIWFLAVDSTGIPGAGRPITAWTLYNTCGINMDQRTEMCGPATPAYPFDPMSNFGGGMGVPMEFGLYVSLPP